MKTLICLLNLGVLVTLVSCKSTKLISKEPFPPIGYFPYNPNDSLGFTYRYEWIHDSIENSDSFVPVPLEIDTSGIYYGYNGTDSAFLGMNYETFDYELYILEKTRYAVVTPITYYLIRFENRE